MEVYICILPGAVPSSSPSAVALVVLITRSHTVTPDPSSSSSYRDISARLDFSSDRPHTYQYHIPIYLRLTRQNVSSRSRRFLNDTTTVVRVSTVTCEIHAFRSRSESVRLSPLSAIKSHHTSITAVLHPQNVNRSLGFHINVAGIL